MTNPWQLPNDRIPTEHEEQRDLVRWLRQNHPEHRVFAIPNGGLRTKSQASKLKVEGVTKGVPDLFIPSLRLFVEMKRQKGGRVSPEQKDWIAYLESVGYTCLVCNGSAEAQLRIEEHIGNGDFG